MITDWAAMVARVTLNDLPWDLFESCHNQGCRSCSAEPPAHPSAVEGGDPVTIEDRFNLRARVAAEPPGRYIGLWQINTGAPGRAATWESTWRPPTASDSVKIARIRKLVTEWERRSRATTGDPFLGGMATALHEVAGELKSILDDPDPVVAAHAARWPKDCRTGVPCPKCSAEIVYNGNYFCSEHGDRCDWVMSEGDTGILFTRCNEGLLTNRMSP